MSSLLIGLVVFFTVFAPLLHIVSRTIEKQRLEKERKITQLTYRYLTLHGIYARIPKAYSLPALMPEVIKEAIRTLTELHSLAPKDRSVGLTLKRQKALLQSILRGQDDGIEPPVKTFNDVRNIQYYQSKLVNFIELKQRHGQLTQGQALNHVRQIQWLARKCLADMYSQRAREASEKQNYQLAAFLLKKAIAEIRTVDSGLTPDKDALIRTLSNDLARAEQALKEQNAARAQELEALRRAQEEARYGPLGITLDDTPFSPIKKKY